MTSLSELNVVRGLDCQALKKPTLLTTLEEIFLPTHSPRPTET